MLFLGVFIFYHQPWIDGSWSPWIFSSLFLQNLFVDLSQGTFGVAWSLCVEEWLYLILPLFLAAYTGMTKKPAKAALYTSLTLILVPSLLRCTAIGRPWDLGVRHIVVYRLDAIAYGVLLAYFCRYQPQIFARLASRRLALIGTVTLAGISLFMWGLGDSWIASGESLIGLKGFILNVFVFSATSSAIVPIIAWASQLASAPKGMESVIYRTSLYSYSMYLSHTLVFWLMIPLLYNSASSCFGEFQGLSLIMIIANTGALFAFSALTYHIWERPMTQLRERFFSDRPLEDLPQGPRAPRARFSRTH